MVAPRLTSTLTFHPRHFAGTPVEPGTSALDLATRPTASLASHCNHPLSLLGLRATCVGVFHCLFRLTCCLVCVASVLLLLPSTPNLRRHYESSPTHDVSSLSHKFLFWFLLDFLDNRKRKAEEDLQDHTQKITKVLWSAATALKARIVAIKSEGLANSQKWTSLPFPSLSTRTLPGSNKVQGSSKRTRRRRPQG